MDYEQMSNNKLELVGKIIEEPTFSHEVFGEGFYETKIEVARLSEQTDIIPLTISERLLVEHGIKKDGFTRVQGQFRSYNKLDGDKSRLMLTAFIRDILPLDEENINPNSVELSGYICKEPIYRVTPFKREICDILLAINRAYNKSDYIPCITWGRNARFIKNLPVGEKINLLGRIQSRTYQKTYENGDVEDRVAYEVSVGKISLDKQVTLKINGINQTTQINF